MSAENPVKISVLMSVLNCERTIEESFACLLAQTETDWQLILCDDGSTDGTWALAEKIRDAYPKKVVLIRNRHNLGLSTSLNRCLDLAEGPFCARMDGDDRCAPDRFERQAAVFAENPDLAIVSSDMLCFDEGGTWGIRQYPTEPKRADFVHGTPYCHAAAMVRTSALIAVGGYSEESRFDRVEDYELWTRMEAAGFHGRNIHEPLYEMRDDRNATVRRKPRYRLNEARVRCLAVRRLRLPVWMALFALRPLILAVLPLRLYEWLHRRKLSGGEGR